jgi:hypothetical protein
MVYIEPDTDDTHRMTDTRGVSSVRCEDKMHAAQPSREEWLAVAANVVMGWTALSSMLGKSQVQISALCCLTWLRFLMVFLSAFRLMPTQTLVHDQILPLLMPHN